ncbi:MAG: hypothetical protein D6797_04620, partial [Bdellovibrio sp.]
GLIENIVLENPIDSSDVTVEFINQTIQVNIPGVSLPQKKYYMKIDHKKAKSIYSYQESQNNFRTRIIYKKPILAKNLKRFVKVTGEGNQLKVIVDPEGLFKEKEKKEAHFAPPFDLNKAIEGALDQAQRSKKMESVSKEIVKKELALKEKKNQEQQSLQSSVEKTSDINVSKIALNKKAEMNVQPIKSVKNDNKDLPESEIPISFGKEEKKEASSSLYLRMILSLLVVLVGGAGFWMLGKWWTKKYKKSLDNNKIRVLTQHYLGPKKSLAIIQVAGEHILLGVTDQNISMIKTLALIDDDLPEVIPHQFDEEIKNVKNPQVKLTYAGDLEGETRKLKTEASEEEKEDFAISQIKDVVSKKLKEIKHW